MTQTYRKDILTHIVAHPVGMIRIFDIQQTKADSTGERRLAVCFLSTNVTTICRTSWIMPETTRFCRLELSLFGIMRLKDARYQRFFSACHHVCHSGSPFLRPPMRKSFVHPYFQMGHSDATALISLTRQKPVIGHINLIG